MRLIALDAFTNLKRVTKSHIPSANTHVIIDVLEGQPITANEIKEQIKHSKPVGSKDKNPRNRKGEKHSNDQVEENIAQEKFHNGTPNESVSKENQVAKIRENENTCMNYVVTRQQWNQNEIIVDDIFAYHVAQTVINENEDLEPMSMEDC